ncbi:MAG: isochorismatase family protein [Solirubrobacteraceae bacterium]
MRRALLVIDMQEVMRQVLWRGAELAERIAQLVAAAHQSGAPIIASPADRSTGISL